MWKKRLAALLALVMLVALAAGCGSDAAKPAQKSGELKKIRVGYAGGACEAFIFAAKEQGFFKEEGLDLELVKVDFETLKEAMATGKIDSASGMVMKWAKPAEQGIDISFTAGIHTGCIQTLIPVNSDIKNISDLKGKVIGNNGMGDSPMIFTMRVLHAAGLDPKNDVQWRAYPATELEGALERGEVAAITLTDPMAQMIVDKGKAKKLFNTASDAPYKDEYCCLASVSGKLLKADPEAAAAVTRALMKGAAYVSTHQDEVAKMMVEKKYVPGNPDLIARLLKSYNYVPSVDGGEAAVKLGIKEMKAIGVLEAGTDEKEFSEKLFKRLPGVK